jgi:hypothetical protein
MSDFLKQYLKLNKINVRTRVIIKDHPNNSERNIITIETKNGGKLTNITPLTDDEAINKAIDVILANAKWAKDEQD